MADVLHDDETRPLLPETEAIMTLQQRQHILSKESQIPSIVSSTLLIVFLSLFWARVLLEASWPFTALFAPLFLACLINGSLCLKSVLEVIRASSLSAVPSTVFLGLYWFVPNLSPLVVTLLCSGKLDGWMDDISWGMVVFPIVAELAITFTCAPFVYRYANIPLTALQSDGLLLVKLTLCIFASKADNMIEIPWSWGLLFLWVPASIAAFVVVASIVPVLLYILDSGFRGYFTTVEGIREHPMLPGTYINLSPFCSLMKISFGFFWFMSLGSFIAVVCFSVYLDDPESSPRFLNITIGATLSVLVLKIALSGVLIKVLPSVFITAAQAVSLGITRRLHPSTGKCPLCRKSIHAVLEVEADGHTIKRQTETMVTAGVFEAIRQSPTFFRIIYNRLDEECPEQTEIHPNHMRQSTKKVETCYICTDKLGDAVFLNCGHSGMCYECGIELFQGRSFAPGTAEEEP